MTRRCLTLVGNSLSKFNRSNMTLREIIAELQSIGYQLDSALNGNSTLQGASSDLNLLLDMLERQEISEASVTRQKIN